jgi:CRISPR/Cas system CMR-associated protein Cmr3 (group 5 of RAMP superfamily)
MELSMEIKEQSPTITLPCKVFAEQKPLTKEERKAMYDEIRRFEDHLKLPLPEDFFDDDVVTERGLQQLQMDAHKVGLLNTGKLEMSPEKEKELRDRLKHKIKLIREMRGLPTEDIVSTSLITE